MGGFEVNFCTCTYILAYVVQNWLMLSVTYPHKKNILGSLCFFNRFRYAYWKGEGDNSSKCSNMVFKDMSLGY